MKARFEKFLLKVRDDPEILAVFLFGSAARGEQGPGSDLDICLVFATGISDRLYMAQKALGLHERGAGGFGYPGVSASSPLHTASDPQRGKSAFLP
jgi:hypothetical protein